MSLFDWISSLTRTRPASPAPARRRAASLALECLENRLVPTSSLSGDGLILTFRGDGGGIVTQDRYQINTNTTGQLVVLQNNVSTPVPTSVRFITFSGDTERDTLVVSKLPANLTVFATSLEEVRIGQGRASDVLGTVNVRSNLGDAVATDLAIDAFQDSVSRNVTLTSSTVSGLIGGALDFSGSATRLASLTVNAGNAGNVFTVNGTKADTTLNAGNGTDVVTINGTNGKLTVNTLGSSDTINVTPATKDLQFLRGVLTVDGGLLGTDRLFVHDEFTTVTAVRNTLTAGQISRTGTFALNVPGRPTTFLPTAAAINYSRVEEVDFGAAQNPAAYSAVTTISGTAAGTKTAVHAPLAVFVGNAAGSLDDLQGDLSVDGPAQLILNDQGNSLGRTFLLEGNSLAWTNGSIRRVVNFAVPLVIVGAGSGADVLGVAAFGSVPVQFVAGGGIDTVAGPDADTTWLVGKSAVSLANVLVSAVENVRGGAGNDTFNFTVDAQGVAGSVSGTIDGGGGINRLDYSALSAGVTVDLTARTATGVAGGISNVRHVTGGTGDDLLRGDGLDNELRGNGGNDVLVGMDGNDTLTASGPGRNLLIGGNGADVLTGGDGEDLLIGGFLEPQIGDTNDAALRAFLGVWKDPNLSFDTRVRILTRDGVLVNGVNVQLRHENIRQNDGAKDVLNGLGGGDLFWINQDGESLDRTDAGSPDRVNL